MKNSSKAILVHRAYGQIQVILFTSDEAFFEMCEIFEASGVAFDTSHEVITCLGLAPTAKKKAKLKVVKK